MKMLFIGAKVAVLYSGDDNPPTWVNGTVTGHVEPNMKGWGQGGNVVKLDSGRSVVVTEPGMLIETGGITYTQNELTLFARKEWLTAQYLLAIVANMPAEPADQITYLVAQWRANRDRPDPTDETELYGQSDKFEVNNAIVMGLRRRGYDTTQLQ